MRLISRVLVSVLLAGVSFVARPAADGKILPILDHIHLNVPDQAQGVAW